MTAAPLPFACPTTYSSRAERECGGARGKKDGVIGFQFPVTGSRLGKKANSADTRNPHCGHGRCCSAPHLAQGSIVERQKDARTTEWKYLVRGLTLVGEDMVIVSKLSPTGKLVFITVYRE